MLTANQIKNLYQAIELAPSTSTCRYTTFVGGQLKPHCIIGQLAFLEGVELKELQYWKHIGGMYVDHGLSPNMSAYGYKLLVSLQSHWDANYGKDYCRNIVDDYLIDNREGFKC